MTLRTNILQEDDKTELFHEQKKKKKNRLDIVTAPFCAKCRGKLRTRHWFEWARSGQIEATRCCFISRFGQ